MSLDVFHRDERLPVDLAGLVDRADVRVVQRRRGARLFHQPQTVRRGSARLASDQLDGDRALELFVERAVNGPHPAGSKACRNPEVTESLTDHGPGPSEEL